MQMLYICDANNDYTICHNKEKSYKCIAGGGNEIQNPNRPATTNKCIRFPNDVLERIEQAITGKQTTFSAFVVQAVRDALDSLEEDDEQTK